MHGCLGVLLALLAVVRAAETPTVLQPLELKAETFASQLQELPEGRWALVEFFANWCPACRSFQPEYEKIAAFFHSRHPRDGQSAVTVARLDCADYGSMCDKFSIRGYPTLKWGRAADFAAAALGTPAAFDRLTTLEPVSRSVQGVKAFVGEKLGLQLDGTGSSGGSSGSTGSQAAAEEHQHLQILQPEAPHADLNDIEGATLKSWEYLTASSVLLEGVEARQALQDWLDLLALTHPVQRCQEGAAQLHSKFSELWPPGAETPSQQLRRAKLCPGSSFRGWQGCKGSQPGSRGYTCGLWQLFHALAARVPEGEQAGAQWLAAVKGFVKHFFQCADCAKHFVGYASSEAAARVASKRDAVLWLWRTHNLVNERLGKQEKEDSSSGDPEFPHTQWPSRELCPACHSFKGDSPQDDEVGSWVEDEVFRFLVQFYSHTRGSTRHGHRLQLNGAAGNGWPQAAAVCGAVCAVVALALRGSKQYTLRRSRSSRYLL